MSYPTLSFGRICSTKFQNLCLYVTGSLQIGTHLRAIAGNTSRIKIFLILCIKFILCMDCRFMKQKGYVTTLDFS